MLSKVHSPALSCGYVALRCQPDVFGFCLQELVTILWSLARLHHQPDPEWMSVFFEAAEAHLPGLTGSQLAQMGYALGQLGVEPPAQWMELFLTQVGLGVRCVRGVCT